LRATTVSLGLSRRPRDTRHGVPRDGNKSLYLVFVGVVFSQHLGLLLEQIEQQHLDCF
jgi:hypothetical protein